MYEKINTTIFTSGILPMFLQLALYFSGCKSIPFSNGKIGMEMTGSNLDDHHRIFHELQTMTDEEIFGSNHLPLWEGHQGTTTETIHENSLYDKHLETQITSNRNTLTASHGNQGTSTGSLKINEQILHDIYMETRPDQGSSILSLPWENINNQRKEDFWSGKLKPVGNTGKYFLPFLCMELYQIS